MYFPSLKNGFSEKEKDFKKQNKTKNKLYNDVIETTMNLKMKWMQIGSDVKCIDFQ